MVRGKDAGNKEILPEEDIAIIKKPLKIKATNGDIPVKYDDAYLWYDTTEGEYYMTLKIGGTKKLTLVEDKE
jgi:hypothetical protein